MLEALQPTQDTDWVLSHEGYNVLTESAVESRFAFGNGFLGMRAARSVSRGPTWVGWLGYGRWASWPRCYVAGLFDVPNIEPPVPALVPVADWSRVRILLDGEPLLGREGEVRVGIRKLDIRRGVLFLPRQCGALIRRRVHRDRSPRDARHGAEAHLHSPCARRRSQGRSSRLIRTPLPRGHPR